MQMVASIFIMAALASGELDWSKITLEPTTTPIPTATGSLDLSGIILDGPGTTSAAVGIDLSGYTLEPPESDTPAAGVLRPQIWTGPVSAPRERQVRQLWLLSQKLRRMSKISQRAMPVWLAQGGQQS